jgi:holo-[acyl-carrier protein] synthase
VLTGVGIDMIEVDRVASKIGKDMGFRELVFSPVEICYCEAMADKYQHYAARFAAKEAFFKALGTGWQNGTAFNEVEISNNADGKPELTLIGQTAELLKEQGPLKISVSLTHLKTIASAIVIIEK